MKMFKLLFSSIFMLSLIGCGSVGEKINDAVNNGNGQADTSGNNSGSKTAKTFDMDKITYQVPSGINLVDAKIVGVTAKMMSSGSNQELAAFVQQISTAVSTSNTAYKGTETAFALLNTRRGSIDKISLFSSQSFKTPYVFTIAQYKITTNKEMEPLTLAGEILKTLSNGKAKGLPVAASNAPVDTSFRLILLSGEYESSTFYIAVVIPEKLSSKYKEQGDTVTNAARVTPKGKKLTTSLQKFTQAKAKHSADFLFVVDDSGSMSNNQNALSQAADDFIAEMTSSGLSYRSAVITTGYGATDHKNGAAYHILRSAGIIENNATLLKKSLIAGTRGSATETGIWNAEQALQIANRNNNNVNGAVTLAGMPRVGSTLSVIIISDEKSQYRSRSNGFDFNTSKNIFVDRNIRVYSLINTSTYALKYTQYDDLASSTGGIFVNIENIGTNRSLDFSGFMKHIASDAGGAASSFILTHPATTIKQVKVNGAVVNVINQNNSVNGYTYLQSSRAIVFHGTAVPPSGASIEVSYDYYR